MLQRVAHLWHTQVISLLRKKGAAVVIDMDDDLTSIHRQNKAWLNYHPRSNTPFSWRNAEQACKDATLVTVSTPPLLKIYAKHGRGQVIDNYVPESTLNTAVEQDDVFGWAGTTMSHPTDLQVCNRAVQQLIDDGYNFRVIGPKSNVKQQLKLTEEPEYSGLVKIEDWIQETARLKVAMAPLEISKFNNAKCVDSDVRVSTDVGLIRAGDLEVGMRVWHEGWRKIEATELGERRPGVVITTAFGYQLKLTPEHRMLVNGTWVMAADIKVGDLMTMEAETFPNLPRQTTKWPSDSRMTRLSEADMETFTNAEDVPTVSITPRWGRLLGAFNGDGSVQAKTQITLSCDGQDADWIDLLSEDVRQIGLHPSTQSRTMYDGTVLRRRSITAASAHMVRVFKNLGLVGDRPGGNPIRTPSIPEEIWRSPRDVVKEFIAGYFEADGTIEGTGVSATSKNETLVRGIQRLLLAFGIKSKVYQIRNAAQNGFVGTYWKVYLRRAAADVFEEEIGFRSTRKIARLSVLTSKPHSNKYRPMEWFDEVASIEPCDVSPVDIQVEGEIFSLAGFVSHNSRLKVIEASAAGIPWVASPRQEYRRFHKESGAGLLADTPKDWYKNIKQLLDDEPLRKELGERGREYMRTQTIEANAHQWLEAWTKAYEFEQTGKEPSA